MTEADKHAGEFEKRIGNLAGIENVLLFNSRLEFSIAHRGLRIIKVFRGDREWRFPILEAAGINLEDALTRLNKVFLCQEIPPLEDFSESWNNAPADTNIEQWLQMGKEIVIGRDSGDKRYIDCGERYYPNAGEKISKILSVLNFRIIPPYLKNK
jgi:hypothetical protein